MTQPYVGRFAPSPTGPLHFGSLIAAVASYLEARTARGRWLLRIEDVDRPRAVAGAEDAILRTLDRFGFEWDGPVLRQSERDDVYEAALDALRRDGWVFDCACTRREIADSSLGRDGAPRYPGTCRTGLPAGRAARTVRLRTEPGQVLCFDDQVLGRLCEDVWREVGDFVLKRADGLFAYQLAVVVDDAASGVTDVVRGADLVDSTCRQLWLQRCLGLPEPRYAHLPVGTNREGAKLSKQTWAPALDDEQPGPALHAALDLLGQSPPAAMAGWPTTGIWAWAMAHWRLSEVPRLRSLVVPGTFCEAEV
ncbi:MAG: tRNA glutamyl-Q(34) synthetase GluQRS [Rhodocyclaceae bacterium]|nr:tRNA glutamyl-Q(34) synthetase GluQRS [Rhodocyclaceae bacterium]